MHKWTINARFQFKRDECNATTLNATEVDRVTLWGFGPIFNKLMNNARHSPVDLKEITTCITALHEKLGESKEADPVQENVC